MAIPFVGRDAELATLVDLVRRGHDAHAPAIAIVSAEPGRGKTRLLAETIALLPDVRTIRLAGFEPMEPIALGAASELLRGLSTVPVEGPILAAHVANTTAVLTDRGMKVTRSKHGSTRPNVACVAMVRAIALPTSVDPVKATLSIPGWRIR